MLPNLIPGAKMTEPYQLERDAQKPEFWRQMPHERLLIIQTDALLCRPVDPFFFQFPYLGAPFLPRQHSEYFEKRRVTDASAASSKLTPPSMALPIQMCIPTCMATAASRSASAV